MSEQKSFVVGIDGGGSKTHAILVGMDGSVLAESQGGPAQLLQTGIKETAATLLELITACAGKVQALPEAIQTIVVGLAGAGRSTDRAELINVLLALSVKKKFPLKNINIETDARIALEAAFAGGPGIVVVGGTGSIALYRTEEGKILRAGGWGKVLGDEGSGFALGRDGLNAVMRQFDGRGEKTELTKKAFSLFEVSTCDVVVTNIYHEHADLASFAPRVLEAVEERDRTAHLIIVKNANELSELVRVLTMQVRPKKKLPVALMGGLLESENIYSKLVREKIDHSLPQVVVQKPKFPAAFGATILGLNVFR